MTVPAAAPTRMAPDEAAAVTPRSPASSTRHLVGGPAVAAFEADFASYLDTTRRGRLRQRHRCPGARLRGLGLGPGSAVLVAADEAGTPRRRRGSAGAPRAGDGHRPEAGDAHRGDRSGGGRVRVAAVVVTHLHGDAVPLDGIDAWRRGRGLVAGRGLRAGARCRLDGRHVGTAGEPRRSASTRPRTSAPWATAARWSSPARARAGARCAVRLGRALPRRAPARPEQPARPAAGRGPVRAAAVPRRPQRPSSRDRGALPRAPRPAR